MAKKHDHTKLNGVHYTPTELAAFLSRVTRLAVSKSGCLDILDPACGDGELLRAIAESFPSRARKKLRLYGFERDAEAAAAASETLTKLNVESVKITSQDFLDTEGVEISNGQLNLFADSSSATQKYDVVIANPPYVRTQVLGAKKSQSLGKRFGITGRVDLYHAFSIAMANSLREGGVLGLLTSNRFLTIKSGIALRRFLTQEFDLQAVYDLGDTKLFKAAVLPVILVGRKEQRSSPSECEFVRIYEHRENANASAVRRFRNPLEPVEDASFTGFAETETGVYRVERGLLQVGGPEEIWSLATAESKDWMSCVKQHQSHTFEEVANVRVGIKTTADKVFIRDDWTELPANQRPEKSLIHSLITHHNAKRWSTSVDGNQKSVVYPHTTRAGKKAVVDLAKYPKTTAYFESFSDRLRSRKYVIESGRQWYEIWVPHNPADWERKKVVFPDISESPTFFLDESGSIVNGDCYWITTKDGYDEVWLYLILAVANSSFIEKYYDTAFHNKLYAGRRRFMTQYVKQFPLPHRESANSVQIIKNVKKLLRLKSTDKIQQTEKEIDRLVWGAFGFSKEV